MINACVGLGEVVALCVVSFAAGATVIVAFVLALGLLGEMVDRFDGEDCPRR